MAATINPTIADPVISVRDLVVGFGPRTVLDHVTFEVGRGEVFGFVGGSGSGKSVLLRTIIGLIPRRAGSIEVLGTRLDLASDEARRAIERRWGILFQQGALFSSLTALQNVQFPMVEYLDLPQRLMDEMAAAKLDMVGLTRADHDKLPSELSGGMTKRVALARALALDPELVFLDEPTSGLDPISARAFDSLIRLLADSLGLTVFLVTHDLDTLFSIIDRVIVLSDGRVLGSGTLAELKQIDDPWLRDYFAARAPNGETAHGN